MKKSIFFILAITLCFSCKKKEDKPPAQNTTPAIPAASAWSMVTTTASIYFGDFLIKGNKLFATVTNSVLTSIDNGSTWTSGTGITSGVGSLADDGTNMYAGGAGFYSSSDNGSTWTPKNNGITSINLYSLKTSSMGIIAGTSNGVYVTNNGGNTWTSIGLTGKFVVSLSVAGNTIFAGTAGNGLYSSADNGNTWTLNSPGPGLYIARLVVSGNNVIANTESGNYVSTDNGANWIAITVLPNSTFICFSSYANKVLVSLGTSGIFLSSDNGLNWTAYNEGIPANSNMAAIYLNNTYAYVCTNDYKLYRRNL
jgi:hypothetical protein